MLNSLRAIAEPTGGFAIEEADFADALQRIGRDSSSCSTITDQVFSRDTSVGPTPASATGSDALTPKTRVSRRII
jgi:hypothetical protein